MRGIGTCADWVGWVERSETHRRRWLKERLNRQDAKKNSNAENAEDDAEDAEKKELLSAISAISPRPLREPDFLGV
jgi:hypothetical protein